MRGLTMRRRANAGRAAPATLPSLRSRATREGPATKEQRAAMSAPGWSERLDAAAAGDPAALLDLTRHITSALRRYGAYEVRDDWSRQTREIGRAILERWQAGGWRGDTGTQVDRIVKNRFWEHVLRQVWDGHATTAERILFPALRRVLAGWDRTRAHEDVWDDVIQDSVTQLWKLSEAEGALEPWSLLCTIARRRFVDRMRALRPHEEIPEEVPAEREDDGLFTREALAELDPEERAVIVQMDLEGRTRVEIARELGTTEGAVLSQRRAGLRKLWRWLGRSLPDEEREVWDLVFVGARRDSPDRVAVKLGIPEEEVLARLESARRRLGVDR